MRKRRSDAFCCTQGAFPPRKLYFDPERAGKLHSRDAFRSILFYTHQRVNKLCRGSLGGESKLAPILDPFLESAGQRIATLVSPHLSHGFS